MLKTVSSITNAIGALNYKGTWNASTNTPTLASGVGTKGDYYVVSVAGSTALDGISTWYVGDWVAFNGTAWQRLEGGVDDPAPSLKSNSSTGLMQINGPAAGQTRVVTVPDANATMARTDSGQTFTGTQQFNDDVLVGATTSAGSASNVKRVTGGRFTTINGQGFTANTGVATTIFTLTNTAESQTWLVCADLQGEGTTSYACVSVVTLINNSVTQAVPLVQGGLSSISVSGLNVQYTQSSGGNKTNTQFSAIRIM